MPAAAISTASTPAAIHRTLNRSCGCELLAASSRSSVSVCRMSSSAFFTSDDRIRVETKRGKTIVTYDAELRLKGPLGLFDLGLRLVFGRIGDRAAAGLREALRGVRA
jgi:hypothetical protein